jgi:cyclopropane fatty-acyl-phospholipid synthase-like methyltransferase
MRESEIVDAVVEYYEGKLAAFGGTARGVDWKDEASQIKRFEQLARALAPNRSSRFEIIDFGCGYGALLPFLNASGFHVRYTGYDCSAEMIDAAQRLHADSADATFTSDWAAIEPADYVVASGVFNVRLDTPDDEWRDYVFRALSMMNEKATAGWAANFLTSYADEERKRPDLYYADPAMILDWCKRSASRWVCLLHDYELYEFTVGVERHPR